MHTGSNAYYGTIYSVYGNDIDRINNINDQMKIYFRTSVNRWLGLVGHNDPDNPSSIMNVKSGSYGIDFIANPTEADLVVFAGIYVGSYGSVSSTSKDISDRILLVEGGDIANIIGGLKLAQGSGVETKIYVKGGTARNIVGGAGLDTTYENRIIQVTGGTVRYSISGGSNGVDATTDSRTSGKMENANILVYVGGNAQIGEDATIGTSLYGVEAGCVLGAGNGNANVSGAGQVDNSHVIIDGQAHILNSVYGGGNYGIVGNSSSTSAKTIIDILGGTIEKNVYGGANQNNIYGSSTINVKGGQVKGGVYGGSNTKGTIYTTSTINVTGGTLGEEGKTTDNGVLFGGGYGEATVVTGDTVVNILDTDNDVKMYGSSYGGSSLGKMNSNVTINIQDLPNNENTISISGYLFAGGKGNSSVAATIAGSATINVDGSDLPECSVFGGNDLNGTTSGNITVNIGKTYKSTLYAAYGGGNQADITTATPNVNVYLLENADVTNAFNGGKAADLQTAGISDTTRGIYLQGGHATNIFGGSDSSGTVTASKVYIQSGTAENVYGGNNIGGQTSISYVYVTGGNSTNVYGGGYQAETPTTNVSLTGGTVVNGFGGGNAANVTNSSIILEGSIATNIYGGSNQKGTVTKSYVAVNSGSTKNVYGGNNAGGETIYTEVIVNAEAENVYGGGNEAITSGYTNVKLTNANITGSVYGGGNGVFAVVEGNSTTIVEGTTTIAGNLFAGGNAAANGTTEESGVTTVYITGGTIGGDVYGAANTSVVYGNTEVKIGTTAVNIENLVGGNIDITGTVFGGGKSNSAGSENYDFDFESVTGNVDIEINAEGHEIFNIKGSIFGSGNACSTRGTSYITIQNYGTIDKPKNNVSLQRANCVNIIKSAFLLSGATDRTNEYSGTFFSISRVDQIKLKNNSVLYLCNNANLLTKLDSLVDINGQEVKGEVLINEETGEITKNVDNRIYMLEGKNLNVALNEKATLYGQVQGMFFLGLFTNRNNPATSTGLYHNGYNNGDTITNEGTFVSNSYVIAEHLSNPLHDIEVDGFYTNYNEEGVVKVKYIKPTPDADIYYMWLVGKELEVKVFPIDMVASKYATLGTYELALSGFADPNIKFSIAGFSSGLINEVSLVDPSLIQPIEFDEQKADTQFGLSMKTGNIGWQNRGQTMFLTQDGGTYKGTTNYNSDNTNYTPTLNFCFYHSQNLTKKQALGDLKIRFQVMTPIDDLNYKISYIDIDITLSTALFQDDYYEAAITTGQEFGLFTTTDTTITDNSTFSTYYSLLLNNFSDRDDCDEYQNYKRVLVSRNVNNEPYVFPQNTKFTMLDMTTDKYYYYVVTEEDVLNGKYIYSLSDFIAIGSNNMEFNESEMFNNYYNEEENLVYENFIFHINFSDATLSENIIENSLLMELRNEESQTIMGVLGIQRESIVYTVFCGKSATIEVDATLNQETVYLGKPINLDVTTAFTQELIGTKMIYDTQYFDKKLGIKISIYDNNGNRLNNDSLLGINFELNGQLYYPRIDGTTRISIADKVTDVLAKIKINTENNSTIATGSYKIRIESFGSSDGIYYGLVASDMVEVDIIIINYAYGLKVTTPDKEKIINHETGKASSGNNSISTTIKYSSSLNNPNIAVSLYRRDYTQVVSQQYNLVDLKDYVTTILTPTPREKEYEVSTNPVASSTYFLLLKENLVTGTYKLVYKLYDGNTYVGEAYEYIIIK